LSEDEGPAEATKEETPATLPPDSA